jgi:hypothetical protein
MPNAIPEEVYDTPTPKPGPKSQHSLDTRKPVEPTQEELQELERVKEELYNRCENWHGLDFQRFGRLLLYGNVRVGKDRQTWQELECYLFTEMLICVKVKKTSPNASQQWDGPDGPKQRTRVTLKGSILIKKHLKQVETVPGRTRESYFCARIR